MINVMKFALLAGQPHSWDRELVLRVAGGEALTGVQEDQHRRGRRTLMIVQVGGKYVLRSASPSLWEGDWSAVCPGDYTTMLRIRSAWVAEHPGDRELIVLKSHRP